MTFLTKRSLLRVAVAGAVAVGAPLAAAGAANAAPAATGTWDKLAQCESGGNWGTNTGNGFSGGLQFAPGTWRAFGGTGPAHGASRAEQVAVAERVLAAQGWGAWPACSRNLGLHGTPANSDAPAERPATRPAAPPSSPTPRQVVTRQPAPSVPADPGATHTVVAGDTLSTIAAAHGTTWQALFAANRDVLSNPNLILVGQVLRLG